MRQVNSTEWLVLNATADDAENLEQIYRSLAFVCSPDRDHPGDPDVLIWREARPPILLSEIADAIQSLVSRGLLVVRWDPAESSPPDDLSYIWKAWFEMSAAGRARWQETEEPSRQDVAIQADGVSGLAKIGQGG